MIDLDSALHANRTLVPLIYEAAAGTRSWSEVLRPLAEFLDSQVGFITISYLETGRGEVVASHGLPPEFISLWEARHAINDWVHLAASEPAGRVLHAARDVPVSDLAEKPVGQDLLVPQGLKDAMGVKLTDSQLFVGAFSVYSREGILPARALHRLEFLTPHLAQALALHQRFSALTTQSEAFARSIDDLSSGLVFFDASGHVLHCNALARLMADESDGFSIRDDRLTFDDRAVHARLDDAVAQAMQPKPSNVGRGFFRVERPSGGRPYHAIVSRAATAAGGFGATSDGTLVLWLSDPEHPVVPSEKVISALLGLTPAEARISAGLAKGLSLREYAQEAGITENTARSTLKHVFAKTETRSQADLVRLITQSIPGLPF